MVIIKGLGLQCPRVWHHAILQSGAEGFNYENHQGPERFWPTAAQRGLRPAGIGNNAHAAAGIGQKRLSYIKIDIAPRKSVIGNRRRQSPTIP
jgi:hypothetical protein